MACLGLGAIAQQAPVNPQVQPPAPLSTDLNTILLQVQKATSSANVNLGKLRIEKWKTDSQEKQQMQQVADSLQKNIANAVPGLISDVQTSRGGVLASFKLYHNLNVVYEFLSSMAEAAGAYGKKEEYQPLEGDATALDTVRQNLSTYIEQASGKMEAENRAAAPKVHKEKDFYSSLPAPADPRAGFLFSSLISKKLELVTPGRGLSILKELLYPVGRLLPLLLNKL
jgi:hypothetical protein